MPNGPVFRRAICHADPWRVRPEVGLQGAEGIRTGEVLRHDRRRGGSPGLSPATGTPRGLCRFNRWTSGPPCLRHMILQKKNTLKKCASIGLRAKIGRDPTHPSH